MAGSRVLGIAGMGLAASLGAACGTSSTGSSSGSSAAGGGVPAASATPQGGVVAGAGPGWTELHPSSAPLARNSGGFAYDAATHSVLLSGGRSGCAPSAANYTDTWSWNGTQWTQLHPTNVGPGGLSWFSMAFDDASQQVIAVGVYSGCGIGTAMWTWSGTQWTQVQGVALPDPLSDYRLAYDAASHQFLAFGYAPGYSNAGPRGPIGPETWTWDGKAWGQLHPATSPPALVNASMTYDASSQQVILFGGESTDTRGVPGTVTNATWAWNGTTWTELHPVASPSPRIGASFAYDPDIGAAVLFGGASADPNAQNTPLSVYSDMWTWTGTNWAEVRAPALPPGRFFAHLAYDASTHDLVLFGGALNQSADRNDTWVFGRH